MRFELVEERLFHLAWLPVFEHEFVDLAVLEFHQPNGLKLQERCAELKVNCELVYPVRRR